MLNVIPGNLTLDQLRSFYFEPTQVELNESCWAAVDESQQTVAELLKTGESIYGLNTGFGLLAKQKISGKDLAQLQLNLVRSHAAGVGEPLDQSVVRLIMLLKLASLARGYSGVSRGVIEHLTTLLNAGVIPVIPSQGSVGASGDLAPLAHMSLPLIGEGRVWLPGIEISVPAQYGLDHARLSPLELGPKEGLALLNGTQVSTALALAGLFQTERVFGAAVVAGAMSIDAAKGSDTPFDPRIHTIRNHPTQVECAAMYRDLLDGSEIRASHVDCDRVQDPYSLRCQPQVMGGCLESINHAHEVLLREANAVSDNPLVFSSDKSILSGGNFHAEPVGLVADQLAVAIAEIGALSERRIALLIDRHLSNLPSFLVKDGGLNSGFMIPQVTAAALVAENQHLAGPITINSLPTSANQEDHVSMATYAARRLTPMSHNAAAIVAIELLAACQGIDFHEPLKTSPPLEAVYEAVRALVPHYYKDRAFDEDIAAITKYVLESGELAAKPFPDRSP